MSPLARGDVKKFKITLVPGDRVGGKVIWAAKKNREKAPVNPGKLLNPINIKKSERIYEEG